MREFAFELALCAALEADYPVVGRQLGAGIHAPGGRVVDVVCIEPAAEFDERVRLSPAAIPVDAIEADVGVGHAKPWRRVIDAHPEKVRRVVDQAVEAGFFERERRNGREYVRKASSYPSWFSGLVAIENKPDLGTPGDLATQLRKDVSLALFDAVVLATESYVTRAHLHRLPEQVGVWRFDPDDPAVGVEVVREPARLDVDADGVEIVEEYPGRTDIVPVSAAEKRRTRTRVAERAYGKGWRTYGVPGCVHGATTELAGSRDVPYCATFERVVDAANECGPVCSAFTPASPPDVDLDAERERRTAWRAETGGGASEQVGLDRFE